MAAHKRGDRILLVDDDVDTLWLLARTCEVAGYQTTRVSTGREALQELESGSYHVALLDLRLPDMSGIDILREAHERYPDLCAIILTSSASLDSAIAALQLGAIDYIEKPVKARDVLNAIQRALERRSKTGQRLVELLGLADQMVGPETDNQEVAPATNPQRFETASGPVIFEPEKLQVTINGRDISLTPGETDVLEVLLTHFDQPLSPEDIAVAAWGKELESVSAENIIRPHIHRLRQKVEANPSTPRTIVTARGKGYVIRSG